MMQIYVGSDLVRSGSVPIWSDPIRIGADLRPIQNGRALQSDIREIRRIIKAYVGRLQDREVTNHVAKEWRIVARVLDRLFFMLYIGTIVVSLATMFPKGEAKLGTAAL